MTSTIRADRRGPNSTNAAAPIAALVPAVTHRLAFPDLDNAQKIIAANVAKIVGQPKAVCIAVASYITCAIIRSAIQAVPSPIFAELTSTVSVSGRRFGHLAFRRGILSAVTIATGANMLIANAFAAANAFKWSNFFAGYARYTVACFGFAALRFLKPEFYSHSGSST